jgi:hypothetical protein
MMAYKKFEDRNGHCKPQCFYMIEYMMNNRPEADWMRDENDNQGEDKP